MGEERAEARSQRASQPTGSALLCVLNERKATGALRNLSGFLNGSVNIDDPDEC